MKHTTNGRAGRRHTCVVAAVGRCDCFSADIGRMPAGALAVVEAGSFAAEPLAATSHVATAEPAFLVGVSLEPRQPAA